MKLIRIIVIGLCIAVGYYIFSKSRDCVEKIYPSSCTYVFDALFSKEFKKSIEAYIDQAYAKNPDPENLVKAVAGQFPALQEITFDVCEQEYTKFILHGHKPLLKINNEYVVLASGKLFPASWYNKKFLHELYNVCYQQEIKQNKVDKRFVKFFVGCPQVVLHEWDIVWKSHEEICMQCKKDMNVIVRTHASQIPEMQDLEMCKNMKEKMGIVRGNKKGKKQITICDMRFSQQLVVSSE